MKSIMLPVAGLVTVRSFMVSSLTTYLPTYLTEEGANLWLAGASLAVLEAAGAAGALCGGSLSDRFGRRIILLSAMLTSSFFMFLFPAVSGWVQFPLLIILGFSLLSMGPVIMALVQKNFAYRQICLDDFLPISKKILHSSSPNIIIGPW